jgi:dihydropteroate synthase
MPLNPCPAAPRYWRCGRHQLPLGAKTYVMGIVNTTPDSFSGDGRLGAAALERALQMVEDGADILDIGGESTRPGAPPVEAAKELRRVLPVVEALAARVPVPLSVDTTKAAVAREVLTAGATIINDISGGVFDAAMLDTIAPTGCGYVIMHRRGRPQSMAASERVHEDAGASGDVIAEILACWRERLAATRAAGIVAERIALDAGFGFGKSVQENLEILRRGRELAALGLPTLSATSRKSTIGRVLGDVPVDERIWGTAAATALAIGNGADIVRVHDVRAMSQVARFCDAVIRGAMP